MKKHRLATGVISIALALTMVSTTAFAASMSFVDVPSNHWASESIAEMAERGVMAGVGNNQFAPDNTFTYAEFLTMLTRQFYSDSISGGGENWYDAYVNAAKEADILSGLSMDAPTDYINRYEMAQLMYNVMMKQGATLPSNFDTSKIGDWASIPTNYQKAVSACYSLGTLSGTDGAGTFSGNSVMTRAQAAVVMDRLIDVCATKPSTPTNIPANATHITSIDQFLNTTGGEAYENGVHLNPDYVLYGAGGVALNTRGYSTITFTVRAGDKDTHVEYRTSSVNAKYGDPNVLIATEVVSAGNTRTFTYSCSDTKSIVIYAAQEDLPGNFAECWITDIYLW